MRNCGERISVFGESHIEDISEREGIDILARLPIDPMIASMVDTGCIEELKTTELDECCDTLLEKLKITE